MSGVFRTIDPPPPLPQTSVSSPRPKARGRGVHTRRMARGWWVNISEDARHWIGLLQYNPSKDKNMALFLNCYKRILSPIKGTRQDKYIFFGF